MSYLSRARVDTAQEPGRRALLSLARGPYAEHQLLWTFWGTRPDARRDFLFRRVEGGALTYYLLSDTAPCADVPGWQIEAKPFEPVLRAGTRLAFDLRANPVVTRRSEDGKPRRHDVVCDALRAGPQDRLNRAQIEREAGLAWLARQGGRCGFHFDAADVRTGAYRQERVRGNGKDIRYSTLDFSGRLTVTEPVQFLAALAQGVGKAKAFGCGLLLIRRAD